MESEIENLKNSICETLGYMEYMCSHCGRESKNLLQEAAIIDKITVVKVNKDIMNLLNGMSTNLSECITRFSKAVEGYNREANKATSEPISQAKKKVNLRLNDDGDTVVEDPPLFSNREGNDNLEVHSLLSADTDNTIIESLSTKSRSDSFDNPDTDSDASMSDEESVCRLPTSSDSLEEGTPCTKNIKIGIRRVDELSDQEIDRLCDLNSLNKRKCRSVLKPSSKHFKRIRLTSSSSESLNPIFDPDKQNQMFTDYILDNLGNDSQSNTEIEDATTTSTKTSQSSDSTSEEAGDTSISKTQLLLSDLELVSNDSIWKNDTLHGSKLSSSDSDSDKEDRKVTYSTLRPSSNRHVTTSEFDKVRALPNNPYF